MSTESIGICENCNTSIFDGQEHVTTLDGVMLCAACEAVIGTNRTPETDAALTRHENPVGELLLLCKSLERERNALNHKLDALPADWAEDSSIETWFPYSAQEIESLKEQLAATQRELARVTAERDAALLEVQIKGEQLKGLERLINQNDAKIEKLEKACVEKDKHGTP